MDPRGGLDVSEKVVDVSGERTAYSLKVEWENGGMFVSAKLHGVTCCRTEVLLISSLFWGFTQLGLAGTDVSGHLSFPSSATSLSCVTPQKSYELIYPAAGPPNPVEVFVVST